MLSANPTTSSPPFTAFVSFPSPLITRLITSTLARYFPTLQVLSNLPDVPPVRLLQWADYDVLSHQLTLSHPRDVLSSSYVIRKALIRKHFLASAIEQYVAKHPESVLSRAAPKTWAIELRWADELDEMWVDELWDLGEAMDRAVWQEGNGEGKWWILKPGMADKGQGIRVFGSRDELEGIVREFEDEDEDDEEGDEDERDAEEEEEEEEEEEGSTRVSTQVSTQQMRHFVIQEYVHPPLLVSPYERSFVPHKFHIRAYVVSVSSSPLQLLLHPRLLCLFAATPYTPPSPFMNRADMGRHLTNTCLQDGKEAEKEKWVFELDELVGKDYDTPSGPCQLTSEDAADIRQSVGEVLAETWRAAIGAGQVHFQPLPNAFELFGADLLLSLSPPSSSDPFAKKFRTHILELNASPDIDQTGSRLQGVIDDLVDGMVRACVVPWAKSLGWEGRGDMEEGGGGLVKILEVGVRG